MTEDPMGKIHSKEEEEEEETRKRKEHPTRG